MLCGRTEVVSTAVSVIVSEFVIDEDDCSEVDSPVEVEVSVPIIVSEDDGSSEADSLTGVEA